MLLKNIPTENSKTEGQGKRLLKRPAGKAFSKESAIVKVARWAYFKTYWGQLWRRGIPWPLFYFLGHGHLYKLLRNWGSWGAGGMVQPVRAQGHQQNCQGLPKGHPLLQAGGTHQINQDYGLRGHSLTQSPAAVEWFVLLPMVWKRSAKWRYGGQSLADDSLSPGPYLHLLPQLFHNKLRHHAATHSGVQVNSSQWQQWWQGIISRGRWQWQWWLQIQIQWGLDCPIISMSHPIIASLTPNIDVYAGQAFLAKAPPTVQTVLHFSSASVHSLLIMFNYAVGYTTSKHPINTIPLSINQHSSMASCYVIKC